MSENTLRTYCHSAPATEVFGEYGTCVICRHKSWLYDSIPQILTPVNKFLHDSVESEYMLPKIDKPKQMLFYCINEEFDRQLAYRTELRNKLKETNPSEKTLKRIGQLERHIKLNSQTLIELDQLLMNHINFNY